MFICQSYDHKIKWLFFLGYGEYTYACDVLFVHVSSPDDGQHVETDHGGDRAEHGHALEEILDGEHRVEVDCVRRNVDVATERC